MFKNQPKGLIPAALSNMGERFGYYIMNAVLVLFLCSKFGLSEETSALVYSFFYAGIYVLSLVGGIIADRTQNYKGTIISGLIVMTIGYVVLAFPIFATPENQTWLLTLTCGALFLIAFGNGLFKGNLQAIVGQLYDNPRYASQRDAGFQIFYVFINLGGVVAPFVAPLLRSWWLSENGLMYNAELPALCHGFLAGAEVNLANLQELITKVGGSVVAGDAGSVSAFCSNYLNVFNTGIHYSFIASVAAMLISLSIFLFTKRQLPSPAKKAKEETVTYSAEEKAAMATEIKQRMAALFAVLGIAIIPSKRNFTLALCPRFRKDRLHTAGNMAGSQPVLCHYPHSCCDVGICRSCTPWKSDFHTSQDRYRYGFGRIGIPFHDCILDHQRLSFGRGVQGSPGCRGGRSQDRTVGALRTLLLPDCGRAVHFSSRSVVRF